MGLGELAMCVMWIYYHKMGFNASFYLGSEVKGCLRPCTIKELDFVGLYCLRESCFRPLLDNLTSEISWRRRFVFALDSDDQTGTAQPVQRSAATVPATYGSDDGP